MAQPSAAQQNDDQLSALEPLSDADQLQLAEQPQTEKSATAEDRSQPAHVHIATPASHTMGAVSVAEEVPLVEPVSGADDLPLAQKPSDSPSPSAEGRDNSAPTDSVARGYYANYAPQGYYPHYVYWPNYPPKTPALLGYGFGIKGRKLYEIRYIFGHPAGYVREHCPNDKLYGPVYYESGMPVSGPVIGWRHFGNPPKPQEPARDQATVGASKVVVTPQASP